jgi:hypothetical protein
MIPLRPEGANAVMRAPPGQDEVLDLHVIVIEQDGRDHYISRWEPTPGELALLNAGGSVELWCMNGQPPVCLGVRPHADTEDLPCGTG